MTHGRTTDAHTSAIPVAPAYRLLPWITRAAWLLALGSLGWSFLQYLAYLRHAIPFPYGLDYGEGIVWQQAELILGPQAYGSILHFPYIVFHYPPMYHLLVRAASRLGFDMLAAGRGLSAASMLLVAASVGWLTMQGVSGTRGQRALGGMVAGLALFTFVPVVFWSAVMRVDCVALALSLGGTICAAASFRRPAMLHIGMVLFVLAVFTKQTAIVAPVAALAVALIRAPRRGAAAASTGLLLGGLALAGLQAWTGGGFLRHIVAYNLNRFDPGKAATSFVSLLILCGFYGPLAALALGGRWRALRPGWRGLSGAAALIRQDERAAWSAMMGLYFVLSTASLASLGKSGGQANYALEWVAVTCIWLGVRAAGPASPARGPRRGFVAAMLVPLALLTQAVVLPSPAPGLDAALTDPGRLRDRAAMLAAVRGTAGPVLSDDMVLLLRAGKQVPLEPAIFAELAATGRWPEAILVDLLTRRTFGAVVTEDGVDGNLFDERYLPASRDAIRRSYGHVSTVGSFRIRTPE